MVTSFVKAGLGALGSFGPAGLSLIASNASNNAALHNADYLQKQAADLAYINARKTALNNPSWNRQGLEKAGYNPMLAVQNGISGASLSNPGTPSVPGPDYNSAISNTTDFLRLRNETKTAESQQDLNYAQADKSKAEKSTILERLPFISKREKAEIANVEKDSIKKEAQIHNIDETTRFIEKEYELRKRLGEMGIDVQRRGQNLSYNASTYASNINERNNIRTNRTTRGKLDVRLPLGAGWSYYHGAKNRFNDDYYDWLMYND